jgi:hypothetical protein
MKLSWIGDNDHPGSFFHIDANLCSLLNAKMLHCPVGKMADGHWSTGFLNLRLCKKYNATNRTATIPTTQSKPPRAHV